MKKYLLLLPEFVILGLSTYWFFDNYLASSHINYYAVAVAFVVIFQMIFKLKFLGIAIATMISAFSLYMVLAVFSEFSEFETVNSEALQFLLFGLLLCFFGVVSSGLLFYKNTATQSLALNKHLPF